MTQEVASYLADYVRAMIREADEFHGNMAMFTISDNTLHMMNKEGHKFDVSLNYDNNDYGVSRVIYHCGMNGVHLEPLKKPLGVTVVQVPDEIPAPAVPDDFVIGGDAPEPAVFDTAESRASRKKLKA